MRPRALLVRNEPVYEKESLVLHGWLLVSTLLYWNPLGCGWRAGCEKDPEAGARPRLHREYVTLIGSLHITTATI